MVSTLLLISGTRFWKNATLFLYMLSLIRHGKWSLPALRSQKGSGLSVAICFRRRNGSLSELADALCHEAKFSASKTPKKWLVLLNYAYLVTMVSATLPLLSLLILSFMGILRHLLFFILIFVCNTLLSFLLSRGFSVTGFGLLKRWLFVFSFFRQHQWLMKDIIITLHSQSALYSAVVQASQFRFTKSIRN